MVSSSGSTDGGDIFALGGNASATGNGTFDASVIVTTAPTGYISTTQYYGFTACAKAGTSSWKLTNTTMAVTPWTLYAGTLSVSSDGNLGVASGDLTFHGVTLENTAAFCTARAICRMKTSDLS